MRKRKGHIQCYSPVWFIAEEPAWKGKQHAPPPRRLKWYPTYAQSLEGAKRLAAKEGSKNAVLWIGTSSLTGPIIEMAIRHPGERWSDIPF